MAEQELPAAFPGAHHQSHEPDGTDPLTAIATPLLTVKKTSETVNNSTTLQDDDELKFHIDPDETWEIEYGLLIDSGATPDFKASFSVPSGCSINYAVATQLAGAPAIFYGTTGAIILDGFGAGTPYFQIVRAMFRNGATKGDVVLQWAQNTLNASDTKVLADSYLKGFRLKPAGGVQKVAPL